MTTRTEQETDLLIVQKSLRQSLGGQLDLGYRPKKAGYEIVEAQLPAHLEQIKKAAEVVWIYGFGNNYDSKKNSIWTRLEDLDFFSKDQFGLKYFLAGHEKIKLDPRLVFRNTPAEAAINIYLVNSERRIQYKLGLDGCELRASFQLREKNIWSQVGFLLGEDNYPALSEVVNVAVNMSLESINGTSSLHKNSSPGTVGR